VVLVGILKGAMPFLCDLMRSIDLPVTLDTMCVSSYGNSTVSSGHVNIKKDLDRDIRGKNVIVVEDIIDTGITMSALVPLLKQRGAASVELAMRKKYILPKNLNGNINLIIRDFPGNSNRNYKGKSPLCSYKKH
jgi:hypoxanthine phosphoribosyltransferase